MAAAAAGELAAVSQLVDAGADITKRDLAGWTAYDHALYRGHLSTGSRTRTRAHT